MTTLGSDPQTHLASDVALAKLARRHGTPLYVYDLDALRERVKELRLALAHAEAELYFATMANDRLPVLQTLASLGVGACVNSVAHLELARAAGFDSDKIQYTSTGMSRADMEHVQARQIRPNLDSVSQLVAWFEAGGREGGVRVNAASLRRDSGGDRIGLEAASVSDAVEMARRLGLQVSGLHVYVGTNFQRSEEMLPTLDAFFDLASRVDTLGYVNIGGGIGVDYQHSGPGFDVNAFGDCVATYATRLRERLGRWVDVLFEPGRALAAASATFVTAVTDVKLLEGRRFAGVDGSVAIFPRPLHHPDSPHRIREVNDGLARAPAAETLTVVAGRTTFSRDILGSAYLRDDLEAGTLLAFEDAGAYCQSMASRFLGQADPREAWLGATMSTHREDSKGVEADTLGLEAPTRLLARGDAAGA